MEDPKPIADNIKHYIDQALLTVPDDHKGAIVTYVDADGTLRGVVAMRLNDHWNVAAHISKPSGEKPEAGAAVSFTWG